MKADQAAQASSDVLDEFPADRDPGVAAPQHSIVAALNQAGVVSAPDFDVTVSDLEDQLPDASPQASGIDGLVVDADQAPAEPAGFSSIDLDQDSVEKVSSSEPSLDSFIRKMPR